MFKKQKQLKTFLEYESGSSELFSRNSVVTIIRSMLEPVINQNTNSLIFTRLKNKEGLEGLIKRLEYCTNVEMVDTTVPNVLIKDDYIELEFIIFTSPRYNFALIFDYSNDTEKNYTKFYFLVNSRKVNDVYEILQSNLNTDYREKFYLHKPERRENELLNEALSSVLRKLNTQIEENNYKENDSFVIDLTDDVNVNEKIKESSHEIKNQLSILDVYTRLIEKQFGQNKNIDVIKKSLNLISLELNNLKNYENMEIKEVLIQDVIDDSIHLFDEVLKENNNSIKFNCVGYDIHCFVDENKLLSVINNIVKNANEACKNDVIEIDLSTEGKFCKIKISNHGAKIEENIQKKIFDKGFTTKNKGHGIGLFVCKNYIEQFRGTIVLLKSNDDETSFEIKLPMN